MLNYNRVSFNLIFYVIFSFVALGRPNLKLKTGEKCWDILKNPNKIYQLLVVNATNPLQGLEVSTRQQLRLMEQCST